MGFSEKFTILAIVLIMNVVALVLILVNWHKKDKGMRILINAIIAFTNIILCILSYNMLIRIITALIALYNVIFLSYTMKKS